MLCCKLRSFLNHHPPASFFFRAADCLSAPTAREAEEHVVRGLSMRGDGEVPN